MISRSVSAGRYLHVELIWWRAIDLDRVLEMQKVKTLGLGRWRLHGLGFGGDEQRYFIVPWGNFQTYFFRPVANDGQFCSLHTNRLLERSWREFMDGSTVRLLHISKVVIFTSNV